MNSHPSILEDECLQAAKAVLTGEADSLQHAANSLDNRFFQAVKLLLAHQNGKVIVTGIGKSGHIGQKIVSTFCGTGTPAVFLHATEAVHGDLGIYTPGDPTIIISKSGTTAELVRLIPILRDFESPLIGILGNINSPLARAVDIVLDASVLHEADHLNLAPTSSSTVALALGDALATVLVQARGFNKTDFARLHPSGQLGRNLWLSVSDILHPPAKIACVSAESTIRQVVIEMTRFPLGAACILDEQGQLVGLITDGDLRRILQIDQDIRSQQAKDLMTRNPITVGVNASLKEAVDLMENRPSQISVLPVVDDNSKFCGLIRLHDIYQSDLRE
jgi:arabinose-5-phosphate isomerase